MSAAAAAPNGGVRFVAAPVTDAPCNVDGEPCRGLRLSFDVVTHVPGLFSIPAMTRTLRVPSAGAFVVPVLNAFSDIDGDGIIDRDDGCPFHSGPFAGVERLGSICAPNMSAFDPGRRYGHRQRPRRRSGDTPPAVRGMPATKRRRRMRRSRAAIPRDTSTPTCR
jgi:hypothetical protein